uniref:toprim domain-containing protein n=4 Tax=Pseudomonadota TaxID=1224 RepID=UPI0013D648FF
ALRILASRPGATLVAATDANDQGETFAERLRVLADSTGCAWQRLRPTADDWNEALQEKAKMEKERREEWKKARRAGCAPPASREASPGGAGP